MLIRRVAVGLIILLGLTLVKITASIGAAIGVTELSASPPHYYVGRQGNAYVYAKLSAIDSETETRVLVWFLGKGKGGEAIVRYSDGTSSGTLRCYDDCQFVRGETMVDGKLVHTGRIRVTNDPLISAIMHDAQSGVLSKH